MRFLQVRGSKSNLIQTIILQWMQRIVFIYSEKNHFLRGKMLEIDYNCDKDSCNDYFKMELDDFNQ